MKLQKLTMPEPSRFRRYWHLKPRTVFLNHGSFGACPKPMLELQAKLRRQMEAEPVQFLWRRYEEWLEPARQAVAGFVGARTKDIVFVTNATTAVNTVVRSARLRSGDELLTTDHDYNACRNVLVEAVSRAGGRLVTARVPFPLRSADEAVDGVMQAVTRRTRMALIDHVTSNTALVFPVRRIIRELEARGIETLVDGAHAPGMLPLDVAELGAAYYTGNLHKWVCAPKGAAFLWVREDKQSKLQPAVISHGNNTAREGFTPFQDRFDWAGTCDPTPWCCAGEAIWWMGKRLPGGWDEVRRRNRELAMRARALLAKKLELELPCPAEMLGAMATLPLPARFASTPRQGRIDAEQLRLYDRFRIEVPFVRFGTPERRFLRISAQLYNTIEEYEYLAEAMRRL